MGKALSGELSFKGTGLVFEIETFKTVTIIVLKTVQRTLVIMTLFVTKDIAVKSNLLL